MRLKSNFESLGHIVERSKIGEKKEIILSIAIDEKKVRLENFAETSVKKISPSLVIEKMAVLKQKFFWDWNFKIQKK